MSALDQFSTEIKNGSKFVTELQFSNDDPPRIAAVASIIERLANILRKTMAQMFGEDELQYSVKTHEHDGQTYYFAVIEGAGVPALHEWFKDEKLQKIFYFQCTVSSQMFAHNDCSVVPLRTMFPIWETATKR